MHFVYKRGILSCGKRFAALLLLLSLLSWPIFSDVVLTEDEYTELIAIFNRLNVTLTTQASQIETLETQLQTAGEQRVISQNQIETLKVTLTELDISLKEQRQDHLKDVILAVLISAVGGVALGLTLPFILK